MGGLNGAGGGIYVGEAGVGLPVHILAILISAQMQNFS